MSILETAKQLVALEDVPSIPVPGLMRQMTLLDLCFNVCMITQRPNDEDGGRSDWCNDTLPKVQACIDQFNTLYAEQRTTLSRQAELLGRAEASLKPFSDVSEKAKGKDDALWCGQDGAVIRYADLRTASSTLDAIRDELKGDANGE